MCFGGPRRSIRSSFSRKMLFGLLITRLRLLLLSRGDVVRPTSTRFIAYATATLRTRLSFRCWFEWVDSDSNPSDGRVGLQCEFIASQGWSAEEFALPALFANPADILDSMSSRLNAETVGDRMPLAHI